MKKLLAIVGSFIISFTFFTNFANAEVVQQPAIQVSPSFYDFGDVYQEDGIVSKTFVVTNTSDKKIKINKLSTSCGCTTADMALSEFGPGESREMKVEYDPTVHPDQFGFIERVVYLQISDSIQPEVEINLHGNILGENLLIGGHVPESIIRYLLENPDEYDQLLVYQDKMHGEGTDYKVWDFKGEIKTYQLDEPITTYLEWDRGQNNTEKLSSPSAFSGLFAVITSSAFLDGINPCAIAVLLFFIAFLFSIKKTKRSIWKMGVVYIFAIYLAYFLIGVGLAQAIIISGYPHLMAYVGAYLVIGLGLIQLLGVYFPKFPIRLRIPINTKAILEKWLYKATIPAAFIGGFVVGLCTFPCSGGIYVAIIGMLATSQTYWEGMGWMIWYNLIFVAPLVIILLLAANSKTTEKLQKWERKESKYAKVLIGLTMISLGIIILIFFV